ncbi:type VI secretion system Vgr family protein [Saccharicrinis aurantiacus]|uniref:type VI secretion system Vgr family protein n=1 Tax=Saccharicrinis aurantiacus TaxID=1849719 RepID=UPI0024922B03|nr:phage baseplate assembly protein V [Saccharicrinis aurantiacus]
MSLPQLNVVETEVKVAEELVDFVGLNLEQNMSGHHVFEIKVNYKPNKPNVWSTTPETLFEQLGETVSIKFTHAESGETSEFNGLITNVKVGGSNGDQGFVILQGGSPTLLLDMDPSMGSFMDYTLSNIISETLENTGVGIELVDNATFTTIMPYISRYKESSYAFMARLATACGDWFYYDGQKLILGNPGIENDTKVSFDMELSDIVISAKVNSLNTEIYDYDSAESDYKEDAPVENIDGINSYMRVALDKSSPFFPNPAKLPTNRFMVDENDIVAQMRAIYSRKYSQMSTISAKSNTCAIRIGELVTTRLPESLQQDVGPDLGRYRVTKITHVIDDKGLYSNLFEGVAGMTESILNDTIAQPTAYPEVATIVENEDPNTLGRVKVRFLWMSDDQTSNWIRVQTPNLGAAENNESMHGFHFIPAIDDQVMVAFEHGDPSKPYVTGSLFHRDNAAGALPDNVKSKIVSASGHTIELDDTEGEEKINIYDTEGSIITFDTAAQSLFIQSTENIEITAKNISINAEENITIAASGNVDIAAEGDLNNQAQGNVAIQSSGDTTVGSGGALALEATSDATMAGMNAIIEGSVSAELNATQTKVTGSAMTEVSGGIVKVN